MKAVGWILLALVLSVPLRAEPADGAVLRIDFSNPGLLPSNWTLVIYPDGTGHFHSERGEAAAGSTQGIEPETVDRAVRLSGEFAERAFGTVRRHRLLSDGCESHLKVAFQGWKKITYTGPEGQGSCEFNFAKDRDVQTLGDSFVAVASTIIEGARLELLLQHDPLGLDKEMEYMIEALGDGRLQQVGAIQDILVKLEEDPAVMERVRKRARTLLAQATK